MPGCRCAVVYLTSPTLSDRSCTKATPAVPEPFHTHPAEINDHLLWPHLFHLQPCVSVTSPQIKSTIFEMSWAPQWVAVFSFIGKPNRYALREWRLDEWMNISSLNAATILNTPFSCYSVCQWLHLESLTSQAKFREQNSQTKQLWF